jgi:hypothetical protein
MLLYCLADDKEYTSQSSGEILKLWECVKRLELHGLASYFFDTLLLFKLTHIGDESFDLRVRIFLAEGGHPIFPVGD